MVGTAADLLDALGPPGPNGRADEMHRFDASGSQVKLQTQVEIGRVHANEHIGFVCQQTLAQLLADADDFGQPAHQFQAVAMHCQLVAGPPGVKAAPFHLRTANAMRLQLGPEGVHAVQQQAREQVAGGFARHHGDTGCRCVHGISAQCRAWNPPETPTAAQCHLPLRGAVPAVRQWRCGLLPASDPGGTAIGAFA